MLVCLGYPEVGGRLVLSREDADFERLPDLRGALAEVPFALQRPRERANHPVFQNRRVSLYLSVDSGSPRGKLRLAGDESLEALAHLVPELEGLSLSGCTALTDNARSDLLATTPRLTHLDLEELAELTNDLLSEHLAKAPCAPNLEHLSISYCENLGDTGMLPVIHACTSLQTADLDNTKISDLVLVEAASMIRARSSRTTCAKSRPRIGLRMVVFDC